MASEVKVRINSNLSEIKKEVEEIKQLVEEVNDRIKNLHKIKIEVDTQG